MFAVTELEKGGRGSESSWTLKYGHARLKTLGQAVSTLCILQVGFPILHISWPHILDAGLAVYDAAFFPSAPSLSNCIR